MSRFDRAFILGLLLLSFAIYRARGQAPPPPLPPINLYVVEWPTNCWHFAATAENQEGEESDFSGEATLSMYSSAGSRFGTNNQLTVRLAWDPTPANTGMVFYAVYWGTNTGVYTNHAHFGTNLVGEIVIQRPPPPDRVVRFYIEGGPSLTLTNPPQNQFLRGWASRIGPHNWPVEIQARPADRDGPWVGVAGPATFDHEPTPQELDIKIERIEP